MVKDMNGANTGLEVDSRFRNTNQHFDGDLSVNRQHVDECINNRITSCNICHHNNNNNNNNFHDNKNNKSKKIKIVENLNYGSDNNLNMLAISLFSPANKDKTNNINNNKNINEIISINKQNNKTFDKKSTNNTTTTTNNNNKMNPMKNLRPVLTMDKWLTMFAIMSFLYLDGVECTHQSWWNIALYNFSSSAGVVTSPSANHRQFGTNTNDPTSLYKQIACEKFQGFSSQQRRMCFIYLDHMPALARGAYLALQECQHQFRDHRWNCTVANSSHIYSHFANLGTPEIGFVHSIMSAFIASSLARACKDGELTTCGCSRKDRPRSLPQDWLWEGCGDDVNYGRLFTEKFVKAHYDTNPSKSTREYLSQITERHNGEVGSRTAVMYARPVCKCHGVSGSCNVKTCWEEVAPIRELGNHLKAKYDEAIPVRPSKKMNIIRRKNKSSKKLTKSDIAYFNQPLDYCELNLKKGSFGTKGRFCNKTSSGTDGCSHMCCGRGFYSKKITVHEQCHCKFRWCCEVKCKVCEKIVDIHWCK